MKISSFRGPPSKELTLIQSRRRIKERYLTKLNKSLRMMMSAKTWEQSRTCQLNQVAKLKEWPLAQIISTRASSPDTTIGESQRPNIILLRLFL